MSADTQNKKIKTNVRHEPDPNISEKEYDLGPVFMKIISEEPFLGAILCSIILFPDWETDTAYVGVTSLGRPMLRWNPDFMRRQSFNKKINIIKHELLHIILLHTTKRKIADPKRRILANIAMDLAINSIICQPAFVNDKLPKEKIEFFLPKESCIPGNVSDELMENEPAYGKWLEEAPQLKSYDFYMKEMQSFIKEESVLRLSNLLGVDNHDGWVAPPELEDIVKEYVRKAITDGVMRSQTGNNWGSISSELQKEILESISSEIDWKQMLQNFVGRAKRNSYETTIKKLNKKIPYLLPGRKNQTTARIVCFIDQSSSVGDDDVSLFFAELMNCIAETTIDCYNFDTTVDEQSYQRIDSKAKLSWKRTKSGGTDFSCISNWLKLNENNKWDSVIILTDGYASKIDQLKQKTLWIISPNGTTETINDGDLVVKLKHKNTEKE